MNEMTDLEFQVWIDNAWNDEKELWFKRFLHCLDEDHIIEMLTERAEELHERGRLCRKGLNRFKALVANF